MHLLHLEHRHFSVRQGAQTRSRPSKRAEWFNKQSKREREQQSRVGQNRLFLTSTEESGNITCAMCCVFRLSIDTRISVPPVTRMHPSESKRLLFAKIRLLKAFYEREGGCLHGRPFVISCPSNKKHVKGARTGKKRRDKQDKGQSQNLLLCSKKQGKVEGGG